MATKGKKRKAKRKTKPRKGLVERFLRFVFGSIFRITWWVTSRTAMAIFAVLAISTFYFYTQLPPLEELVDGRKKGSVIMYDRNGDVFAWRGDQYGGIIHTRDISDHLKNAIVATEDKRFYKHFGVDPKGIARAMKANIDAQRFVQGGSTITQQTAKLTYLSNERTLSRKLKEIPIALAMELKFTKEEILTIYLNRAYLGAGTHGFEAAAQRYFGKSATEVNSAEAAMLAGLLKAPSTYSPTRSLKAAQNRAAVVIKLMQEQEYISENEALVALTAPATLSAAAKAKQGGYFADWLMSSGPSFLTRNTTEDVIIYSTFDSRLQNMAEEALAHVFTTKVKKGSKAQAAIILMSRDGAVRAVVGGRTSGLPGQFNRATQAKRQTGSAFKPFVYAAALESGYKYNTMVLDEPITVRVRGQKPWTPKNYSHRYRGSVSLTTALAKSINTTAVRLSEAVGRKRVITLAHDLGIKSQLRNVPAVALGSSESTLLEMTGAYASILNDGRQSKPYGIRQLSLRDDSNPIMENGGGTGSRVLSSQNAKQLVYMMNQVIENGTGKRARLKGHPAAGKTGTTQKARDAWFIGFTGNYVAGVWMGYDDNSKLNKVTGGGLPAEIWHETMRRVHQGVKPVALPMIHPKPAPAVKPAPIAKKPAQNKPVAQTPKPKKKPKNDAGDLIKKLLNKVLKGN